MLTTNQPDGCVVSVGRTDACWPRGLTDLKTLQPFDQRVE